MGITKKKAFDEDVNFIAEIYKALGHPARLQILNVLMENNSCTCGEIVQNVPLAQSTISKHLIELKKANLISEYFEGKKTIFTLKKDGLTKGEDHLIKFIAYCKYKNAFATKKEKKFEAPSDKTIKLKPKNRTANPNLRKYNYIFEHKKVAQV